MSAKWGKLAAEMIRATDAGIMSWKETADPTIYQTSVDGISITVELDELAQNFTIRVYNREGQEVDSFDRGDLYRATDDDWYGGIETLFNTIRRRISGAEQVLDDVLQALKTKKSL